MREADTFLNELGLQCRWEFAADRLFYVALIAAPLLLLFLDAILPSWSSGIRLQFSIMLLLVMWQPLVEELLFRGVIQRQLSKCTWGQSAFLGLSVANFTTSLLFVTAHLTYHAPAWAAAVMVPSLLFGYFRDRYGHILPSLLLHAAFNGSYLLVGAYSAST